MTLSDASDVITIISGVCSVLSLVISGTAIYKVSKIEQKISNSGNNNKGMNQAIKGSNNTQIGKQ